MSDEFLVKEMKIVMVLFLLILRRTYSQRRQHQAARKIQQFMRQSKNK